MREKIQKFVDDHKYQFAAATAVLAATVVILSVQNKKALMGGAIVAAETWEANGVEVLGIKQANGTDTIFTRELVVTERAA